MISPALLDVVRCPDCGGRLARGAAGVACAACGRAFDATAGYLDARPRDRFAEQTKYLDEALHVDARHESVSPPLFGSKIRQDMLRRFLALSPSDRVLDLGCGSGRTLVWNVPAGARLVGIDISPFFAREAVAGCDLLLGDLRRLPFGDGAFDKAWSLDVLEHLSPDALRGMLSEAHRVLAPGGALFVYTHVRRNGWPAIGVRAVNAVVHALERVGALDLRHERLRKSDHLNPLADRADLDRVARECGFAVERITFYTPVIGAFIENLLVRLVEHRMARRAVRRDRAAADSSPTQPITAAAREDAPAGVREARAAAKSRLARRGWEYRAAAALTALMKLDLWLFGRVPSGPFFALLRKTSAPDAERAA